MKINNVLENYYDSISASYEELHKEEQMKKIAIIKKHIKINKGEIILDLGAGPGLLGFPSVECTIVRLDPSIMLLKKAPKQNGLNVLGKAEALPFKDNTFDRVLSVTAMQNFESVKSAVKEIKRVCKTKTKACFVISFLKKSAKKEEIERIIENNFKVSNIIEEDKDIIYIAGI